MNDNNAQRRQGLQYPFVRVSGHDGLFALPDRAPYSATPAFDPKKHRGKALCPNAHCSAQLTFFRAVNTVAGGVNGYPAHFKLKAGSSHIAGCHYEGDKFLAAIAAPHEVDVTKGYRIHYNTSEVARNAFQRAAGPITQRVGNKIECRDKELADCEVLSASNVADFARILRNADLPRLVDSHVIVGQGKFAFRDFLIRTEKDRENGKPSYKRWIGLAQRLLGGMPQPAMVSFIFDQPYQPVTSEKGWTRVNIPLHSFIMRHPRTGEAVLVQPNVVLSEKSVFDIGQKPDEYLAFCRTNMRAVSPTRDGMPRYMLDLKVSSPASIMEADIAAWGKKARSKQTPAASDNGPKLQRP